MTDSFEASLRTVLDRATDAVAPPGLAGAVIREAGRRQTRRRRAAAAGFASVVVVSVVAVIHVADDDGDVAPPPATSTAEPTGLASPTSPPPESTATDDSDLRELVDGTQPRWDPRRVDDLPNATDVGSLLPALVEPPTSSMSLRDAPVEAAVLAVETGGYAQLLSTEREWRSLALAGQYPRLALSPEGTRLLVWHYADGPGDEVVVHDLASGANHRLVYPSEFQPWDYSGWVWTDEQTLLLDELRGGWVVDAETGESEQVPYPQEFAWTPDPDGAVVETSDYGTPAELTDWGGGAERRISEAATGRLFSLRADAETVVGTSYDERPFSVVVADRRTMTPRAVLPLMDHEANYSNGGLSVLSLTDDGTVLLRVAVFGGPDGFRVVRWDPTSGDLSVLASVQTPTGNRVAFSSGLLSKWEP